MDTDYIALVITGAVASTNVYQISINYQVEYTAVGNVLVDIASTPPGPATQRCLASALSLNPQLRLLGHQEAVQLYTSLICTPPRYSSVLNTLIS